MSPGAPYRVTRRGGEVFSGPAKALVAAAEAGRIQPNDLVFDPASDGWIFARNHPLLATMTQGVPSAPKAADRPDAATRRGRRRRAAIRWGLGVAAALSLLGLGLALRGGRSLTRFLEDRDQPEDVERVAVEKLGTGPRSGPGQGAGRAGPGRASPESTPKSPPGDLGEGAAPSLAAHGGPEGGRDDDPLDALSPRMIPDDATREQLAERLMRSARAALADTTEGGEPRIRQLLGAVQRAELADLHLESVLPKHPRREEARALVDDLKEAFLRQCTQSRTERHCQLRLQRPDWPTPVIERVSLEQVVIGMSADHVRAAWGRPVRIKHDGPRMRYCYRQFCRRWADLVDDGVVEFKD